MRPGPLAGAVGRPRGRRKSLAPDRTSSAGLPTGPENTGRTEGSSRTYRTLDTAPATRREVGVLALGAMPFGSVTDEETSFAILVAQQEENLAP
ncbi:hypothetical protein J2X68_006992 [Streptomyces sp. 3330]|nr:hypothetical protein [Streptomyces sp. 3330]